jgi:hypothetical protein
MALQTNFLVGPVFYIPRFPTAGMGTGFAAGVTLDADVTLGVARLTRLQIATRFGRVLSFPVGYRIFLPVAKRIVRFYL